MCRFSLIGRFPAPGVTNKAICPKQIDAKAEESDASASGFATGRLFHPGSAAAHILLPKHLLCGIGFERLREQVTLPEFATQLA